ncbi:MAG: hypothetical protein GY724_05755 [Actinomycetia bacterium]|nr:hypothetical protein [Actinomycetes bacterium]
MSVVFRSFLERINRIGEQRTVGPPTSSNGASSFHVFWELAPKPLVEVAATIEVIEPPTVDKLYFWALQANFQGDQVRRGGAHFGLQFHPAYPGRGAVNWGGYHHGGGELDGSVSALPSTLDNINTRDYPWVPGRPYRYRIYRSPERGWRGSITDLVTGTETVVRDLWIEADSMISPMVWTEAFADCDHPSSAVRWSDFTALTTDGEQLEVPGVRINYQTHADGGCANTNISVADDGLVQRTATERLASTGSRFTLRPRP